MTSHSKDANAEILRYLWTPDIDPLFWRGERSELPSGWHANVPFAHWIIGASKPRIFVELGTHYGISYCAFCEAVMRNMLETRCYAVDTWKGDDQAGHYGEEVYIDVCRFHDERYGSFSRLLRCTFDEALSYFSDGSIDLLHIDGLHTYDSVSHDFEVWRPKLSDRAVVLFHDTNVRERDFGVRRLWEELSEQFPSFEFLHGYGLGVLAVGDNVSPSVSALCALTDSRRVTAIRERFSFLGEHLVSLNRCVNLERELAAACSARETHPQRLSVLLSQAEEVRSATEAHAQRLMALLSKTEAARLAAEARVSDVSIQLRAVEKARATSEEQTRQAIIQRDQLLGSLTWRVARPFHRLAGKFPLWMRTPVYKLLASAWELPSRVRRGIRKSNDQLDVASQVVEPESVLEPASAKPSQDLDKLSMVQNLNRELDVFLAGDHRLSFPSVKEPDVSVIVVLFNQAHFTLQCMRALIAQTGVSLELILVDNCSTDRTEELLAKLVNVHTLRNRENVGFLLGVNQAAAKARGRTILLLNSDAFIRQDALKIALQRLESDDRIGAVGGRLILPSGQLQEAGSIVWSDASAHGYGRNFSPQAGEVMFRRDVDYCSAAFLLTPRALFERMGGFDTAYAPAYYEDADYCLRLWQAGFRVVYEPLAIIDHYEYGSETRDGASIRLMNQNRKRFRLRHTDTLQLRHFPPSQANILFARNRIDRRRRLLVIEQQVPLAALGSGFPRMRAILNEAAVAGWFVTLYPLCQPSVDWEAAYSELSRDIEICDKRGVSGLAEFLAERTGYYDAILVSRPDNMARFKEAVSNQPHVIAGSRLIYDAEAIFAARDILQAELEGRPLTAADADAMISQEIELTNDVDAVVAVTPSEARLMRERQPGPVYVLGYPTRTDRDAPGWESRTGFLFVGRLLEKAAPNYQGLTWFLRLVWPAIRAKLNDVSLLVVGALHPEPVELMRQGVQLVGQVKDLAPLYHQARVFVSPIRFAAGEPTKVLHACAAGLPVVGTNLMARQLGWQPGVEIEAADEPAEMAEMAAALYCEPARWERIRTAALRRLALDHSDTTFRRVLRKLLQGDDRAEAHFNEPEKKIEVQEYQANL